MKIAIEAQRIFRADKHGMDYVILEVLRCLQQKDDGNEYVVFVAPGKDRCLQSTPRMQVVELRCPTYPLWEQWALPRAVKRSGAQLLHCTSNTAPLHCPVPLVLTLHDIIYLKPRQHRTSSLYQEMGWHYRRWNVPRIVNKCRHIITVSETERTNILRCFPQVTSRLTVAHNGVNNHYQLIDSPKVHAITAKYLLEANYLFYLGTTDPRKNLKGILRAYDNYLNQSEKRLKLVMTGLKQKYTEQILREQNLMHIAHNLVYIGYVPEEDLPALYNGAWAFLFPSFMEGFGIPLIEAMACGTPVITSNTSSMPEVGGEGAILINPQNPQEITDALLRLETDKDFYEQQVQYGLDRVKLFSWQHTADEYRKIYQTIL